MPASSVQVGRIALVSEQLDAAVFEERRFFRQLSAFLIRFCQLARDDLAGFHVRLVERIDFQNRARDRRGNFPAEEFLAQVVSIRELDLDNGMAGISQGVQLLLLGRVRLIGEPQMNEHAIVAVNLRRSQRFAIHWDKSFADLAGAFSNQLFQPCAQIVNSGRSNDGDFVSAKISQRPQNAPRTAPGFWSAATSGLQAWTISLVR